MNRDLWTLARQGIWRRRRSSLLLFLVLLLSFAFAVMMLSVMGSMNRTNLEYLKNTYGAWYGAIPDLRRLVRGHPRRQTGGPHLPGAAGLAGSAGREHELWNGCGHAAGLRHRHSG